MNLGLGVDKPHAGVMMKINVVAAVAGGLIVGAGAMVPLGSFAQSGTPTLPPITNSQDLATIDPAPEIPEETAFPTPTPPVPLTPPSFGPGDKQDRDDNDVEYEGDTSDERDHHDDDDDEYENGDDD